MRCDSCQARGLTSLKYLQTQCADKCNWYCGDRLPSASSHYLINVKVNSVSTSGLLVSLVPGACRIAVLPSFHLQLLQGTFHR